MTRKFTLRPDGKVHVSCRLNSDLSGPVGLIESFLDESKGMAVTVTLGRPRAKLRVTVHFRDLSTEPQELRADMIIGIYQPVEENQEKGIDVQAKGVLPGACPGMWPSVSVLEGE